MPRDLKKIIHDYYTELGRAYRTKELNPEKLHLNENAVLMGVSESFEGKEEIIKVYSNIMHLIQEQHIQHQYFDYESCCSILNNRSVIPEIYIRSMERIVVSHGHIIEIHILYDTTAWQNLMQLIQTLSSATSFFIKPT